jgi:hypothetical protein
MIEVKNSKNAGSNQKKKLDKTVQRDEESEGE